MSSLTYFLLSYLISDASAIPVNSPVRLFLSFIYFLSPPLPPPQVPAMTSVLITTRLLPVYLSPATALSLAACSWHGKHTLDHADPQPKTFQMSLLSHLEWKSKPLPSPSRSCWILDLQPLPVYVYMWVNIKYHPFPDHTLHKHHSSFIILRCPALLFHYETFFFFYC